MSDERKDFLEVTDEEIVSDDELDTEAFEDGVQFVTITTDDGRDIEFVEIAEIPLNGRVFTILQPTEEMDELDPDDVLIFEVITDEDGNDIELELVDALEHNGQTYMAFFPAVEEDEDEDGEEYGLVILKSIMENGEELLSTLDSDDELNEVYDLFMERLMEDDEEE